MPDRSPGRTSEPATNHWLVWLSAFALLVGLVLLVLSLALDWPASESRLAEVGPAGLAMAVEGGEPALTLGPPALPTAGRVIEPWSDASILLVDASAWTARSRANVDAALSSLPAVVRAQLGNPALGPIYVSVNREGRTLSGHQPYQRGANFYSTNEQTNEVVLFPDQSPRTILHELGHAYNLRRISAASYAQVFLDEEMRSFLRAAGWRVLTPASALSGMRDHADVQLAYDGPNIWTRVSRDDALEDFANSFALYFSAPQDLQALSPSRYAWFVQRFGR